MNHPAAQRSLLLRLRELLEVQLDPAGVVLPELHFHVLNELGAQLSGDVAPALAGVLLQLGVEGAQVGHAAAGRAERPRLRLRVGLTGLTLLLLERLGRLLERLGGSLHRLLGALRLPPAEL